MNKVIFKTDGKYTKLLKAYGKLLGLEHSIKCGYCPYMTGPELEVELYVKTKWYESVIDVFEEDKVADVSSMREYIMNAQEDDIERFSKKILEGTFGEKRYIKSMKGGDCILAGTGEFIPRFEIHDIPRDIDELMIKLDLAGIDYDEEKIEIGNFDE